MWCYAFSLCLFCFFSSFFLFLMQYVSAFDLICFFQWCIEFSPSFGLLFCHDVFSFWFDLFCVFFFFFSSSFFRFVVWPVFCCCFSVLCSAFDLTGFSLWCRVIAFWLDLFLSVIWCGSLLLDLFLCDVIAVVWCNVFSLPSILSVSFCGVLCLAWRYLFICVMWSLSLRLNLFLSGMCSAFDVTCFYVWYNVKQKMEACRSQPSSVPASLSSPFSSLLWLPSMCVVEIRNRKMVCIYTSIRYNM